MTLHATFATMFCAFVVASTVHGSVLFHNGNPDGEGLGLNHKHGESFIKVYEDFTVPTGESWLATGAYAYFGDPQPSATLGLMWEIRTDMTDESLGTLVASGTTAAEYSEFLGYTGGGWDAYRVSATFDTAVELDAGQTYWLTLYPDRADYANAGILRANGNANAINSLENSFSRRHRYDSGYNFYTTSTDEYAIGLVGVPEPASLALLAAGGMLLITRRHRGAFARA